MKIVRYVTRIASIESADIPFGSSNGKKKVLEIIRRFVLFLVFGPQANFVKTTSDDCTNNWTNPINPVITPNSNDHSGTESSRWIHAASGDRYRCHVSHGNRETNCQWCPAFCVRSLWVCDCMDNQYEKKCHNCLDYYALAAFDIFTKIRRTETQYCSLCWNCRLENKQK